MDGRLTRSGIEIPKGSLCRACQEKIDKRFDEYLQILESRGGAAGRSLKVRANDICGPCKNAIKKRTHAVCAR